MYDVAVIGLGAFGSNTLWQTAERGLKVVGLDQYPVVHSFGSSHGHTRLFRVACAEHIALGSVARRAAHLWRGLESSQHTRILDQVGTITVGDPASDYVKGAIATAHHHEVPLESYDAAELVARFPAFDNVESHEVGLFDSSGGIVGAEVSVAAALDRATVLGADVLGGGRVDSIRHRPAHRDSGRPAFELGLSTGNTVIARRIVLALGPWLANTVRIPGMQALFSPMNWWKTKRSAHVNGEIYRAPQLPGFIRRFDDVSLWGHGDVDGNGLKIGLSLSSKEPLPVDPAHVQRDIQPRRDWENVARVASQAFTTLDPVPTASRACMITTSPDGQFVIGEVGRGNGVYVAGACHGHGFKHASAIGEYVAQSIVDEEPSVEPGIWNTDRFPGFTENLLTAVMEEGTIR